MAWIEIYNGGWRVDYRVDSKVDGPAPDSDDRAVHDGPCDHEREKGPTPSVGSSREKA